MHPQTKLLTPRLPPAPLPEGHLPVNAFGLLEPKGAISKAQDGLLDVDLITMGLFLFNLRSAKKSGLGV